MYTDSSAALGITQRAGIGKVRPLRTQGLWSRRSGCQDACRTRRCSEARTLPTC